MTTTSPNNVQVVQAPQTTALLRDPETPHLVNDQRAVTHSGRSHADISSRHDLLLRETIHRCANDLQMVVSLLAIQIKSAKSPEARQALTDAKDRVAVLARARTSLRQHPQSLEAALRNVCEALNSQAEPRSIIISLKLAGTVPSLSASLITTLALVVNELATNSIKHAFPTQSGGSVTIAVHHSGDQILAIDVDDNGSCSLPVDGHGTSGLGLGLVKRMLASVGGQITIPTGEEKCFEIRVPVQE
jgi:two-component sensor histidine kinase